MEHIIQILKRLFFSDNGCGVYKVKDKQIS